MRAVHRFLVPSIPPVGDTIALPAEEAAHASRVLRLGAGAGAPGVDGKGGACSGVIAAANRSGTEVTVLVDGPREAAREPRMFPLSAAQQQQLPPEPRLQTNPQGDLRQLRAREDEALRGYGWVDKNAGVARIPIEEAMKIVVQRGVPVR